jgi:hypothetical protein
MALLFFPLSAFKLISQSHCSHKYSSQLWTEPLPHATRIYRDANELLGPVEHLTKLGHGHPELIVFHPVDAGRGVFDYVNGIVISAEDR